MIYILILVKGRNCGFVVTLLGMLLLSSYFLYRMIVAYGEWRIDLSFILMGNVSKYSYFAYAYQDGGKTDE